MELVSLNQDYVVDINLVEKGSDELDIGIDSQYSCESCGSDIVIAMYWNTEMDHEVSIDVFTSEWVDEHEEHTERVDCIRCNNIIAMIPEDESVLKLTN